MRRRLAARKLREATQAVALALRLLRRGGAAPDLLAAVDDARAVLTTAATELDPAAYLSPRGSESVKHLIDDARPTDVRPARRILGPNLA